MSRRDKAYWGTSVIAVASLLCGLHAPSLRLHAQPEPWSSAQSPSNGSDANFEQRFSSGLKAEPVFTRAEVKNLFASLPIPAGPEESTAWEDTEAPSPLALSFAELSGPKVLDQALTGPEESLLVRTETEQQPAESTASVPVQVIDPETADPVPGQQPELQEPEIPLLPPAEIVLPAPPATKVENAPQKQAMKQLSPKARAKRAPSQRLDAAATSSTRSRGAGVRTTGAATPCSAGTVCLSQQQSFAIVFGFIAGGILGGPVGAIAGGMAGALLTSPADPPRPNSNPARRR